MNSQEIERQQNAFEGMMKMMLEMLKHFLNFIAKIFNNVFNPDEKPTHDTDGRPLGSPGFEKARENLMEKLNVNQNVKHAHLPNGSGHPPSSGLNLEKSAPDVDLKKENKVIPPENHTETPKAPKEDLKKYDHKAEGRHGIAEARDILKECDRTKSVEVADGYFLVPKKELLEKQAKWKEDDDFKKFDFSRADYFIISKDKQIIVNTPTDLKNFLNKKDKILDLKNPAQAVPDEKEKPKENENTPQAVPSKARSKQKENER